MELDFAAIAKRHRDMALATRMSKTTAFAKRRAPNSTTRAARLHLWFDVQGRAELNKGYDMNQAFNTRKPGMFAK